MKKLSLVGLKATDVAATLARNGAFILTSYNAPLALVLPVNYTSKRELYNALETILNDLFVEESVYEK